MKIAFNLRDFFRSFADLVFPRNCSVCSRALSEKEENICFTCLILLPRINIISDESDEVRSRFWGRIHIIDGRAFLRYDKSGPVKKIFQEIKYKGNRELAFEMGKLMAYHLFSEHKADYDAVIPVPLHHKKQKTRGFNQSEEIALGISSVTGIPCPEKVVLRTKNTKTQTRLDRNERWENVSDIFLASRPDQLENKNILLVDDILTTGSTLESLAECIRSAGSKNIGIAVLAISI